MLARIRKAREEGQGGFTLIELLVVMIIIGILAAIAIPVFLNQRKKAQDSAAKADVSTIGKEVATYYVDNCIAPTIDQTTTVGRYTLKAAAATAADAPCTSPTTAITTDLGKSSANVVLATTSFVSDQNWCVSVKNAKGDKAVTGYKYSAAGGLEEGTC
jgi:prepilin-type N-terminal cleavage/methylation domain-containing protein